MPDQAGRDREAAQASRDHERRHQDAINAMAEKNAAVQAEARKVRERSDRRKADMQRSAND